MKAESTPVGIRKNNRRGKQFRNGIFEQIDDSTKTFWENEESPSDRFLGTTMEEFLNPHYHSTNGVLF